MKGNTWLLATKIQPANAGDQALIYNSHASPYKGGLASEPIESCRSVASN